MSALVIGLPSTTAIGGPATTTGFTTSFGAGFFTMILTFALGFGLGLAFAIFFGFGFALATLVLLVFAFGLAVVFAAVFGEALGLAFTAALGLMGVGVGVLVGAGVWASAITAKAAQVASSRNPLSFRMIMVGPPEEQKKYWRLY